MPLFAVHALDNPDALPLRLEHYAAHRAYVESGDMRGVRVILSGPLQTPDGCTMIGSLFLIEADTQAQVEIFARHDPFMVHGIWGQVSITRFHKRRG